MLIHHKQKMEAEKIDKFKMALQVGYVLSPQPNFAAQSL